MPALVAYTHGDLTWITIADAALATGLVTPYRALPTPQPVVPGWPKLPARAEARR